MRRPVSQFTTLCASVALAFPSYTLPVHAQDRLNREEAIQLCVDKTGSQERDVVGACVIEEFEARGQEQAAQQAREELGFAAEADIEEAPPLLSRDEAIRNCVAELNTEDRQTIGACVADALEADDQSEEADAIRATLAAEAEEARQAEEQAAAEAQAAEEARRAEEQAAAEAQAAEEARQAEEQAAAEAQAAEEARQAEEQAAAEAQAAEEARQAEEQAAAEAQAAEEARQAEEQAAAEAQAAEEARQAEEQAAAEAQAAEEARQAEEQAAAEAAQQEEEQRLTREEAIQTCVARLNSQDRQTVGACVADEFEAAGQTQQAERIRTVLAEEAAAAEAAQEQADAEADAEEAATPITRAAARDACDAQLGREGRDQLRACVADTLEADGQTELAEQVRAEAAAAESRVADEVAARGEPELTEEERRAAERAAAALSDEGPSDAAAADEGAEGEVVEETVAAEDVRTSAEDFETSAVVSEDDDDDGLSSTQKIALGALGALAVGALLNNRTRVVSNSGDRVVVQQDDGDLQVLKDDDALLRQAGSTVRTENFDDGSSRTIVTREDGSRVITVRDASLRVLRRTLIEPDGDEYVLIDDTQDFEPVDLSELPSQPLVTTRAGSALDPLAGLGTAQDDPLRDALRREAGLVTPAAVDRRFSLSQVRNIPEVRALAPAFEVADVTFPSGSAAIAPEQARNLTDLARLVLEAIRENPREVFLIEGHTDAVGDAAYNLALSDRRAESLALALNEYFGVPVENMVVQGYGERFLKVPTQSDERANRRATVRQITGLLQTAAAN
ncbi:OmpA family protein [Jannaschia formosa]|uniref:OmpA family protein n=1 Tax=Jannaschia formosa TaxID=2259592 RepID=UPI000E1C2865|nr:OmpA family protein [Jannaschia formosa]TFL19752.1 OmpA family protein [Jannaschia formosa]